MKNFPASRARATAALLFNSLRTERKMKPEIRKSPSTEVVMAALKKQAERDTAGVQASLPAIVKENPTQAPALQSADDYFNRSPGGIAIGPISKFDGKDGKFVTLADGAEVPQGKARVLLADFVWAGLRRFYGEGEPPGHAGGLLFGEGYRRPARSELDDPDPSFWPSGKFSGQPEDPWRECVYLPLEDRETGEVGTLVMSGATQIIAADGLLQHYRNARRRFPDQYPVVQLAVGRYKHRKFGMLPKPMFKLVGMVAKDTVAAPDTSLAADMNDEIPSFE
jgi:hypothetical protein